MQTKPLLIAAAAFAVTASSVLAHGNAEKILEKANLTEEQKSALETAHDLRKSGDIEAARDTLLEAGFDEEALQALRGASQEIRAETTAAIKAADYQAFTTAVVDTKLADAITSEADFEKLVEAYQLREEGDFVTAKEIMTELGVTPLGHKKGHFKKSLGELTKEQRKALKAAEKAGDRESAKEILEAAGIDFSKSN